MASVLVLSWLRFRGEESLGSNPCPPSPSNILLKLCPQLFTPKCDNLTLGGWKQLLHVKYTLHKEYRQRLPAGLEPTMAFLIIKRPVSQVPEPATGCGWSHSTCSPYSFPIYLCPSHAMPKQTCHFRQQSPFHYAPLPLTFKMSVTPQVIATAKQQAGYSLPKCTDIITSLPRLQGRSGWVLGF